MLSFHPEQYFPIAFLAVTFLNLLAVATLVASKSWRSWRADASRHSVSSVVIDLQNSQVANPGPVRTSLRNLNPREMRQVTEELVRMKQSIALKQMGQELVNSGRMAPLLATARNGNKWKRIDALMALGHLQHPPALALLQEALKSADPDIVLGAVTGLAAWDTPQTVESLINLLDSQCPVNPSRIAMAIEQSTANVRDFLCQKASSNDPVTLFWAATLLSKYPAPETREALLPLLHSTHGDVRAAALTSLAKMGDGNGDDLLIRSLKDEEWYVRAQGARACGEQRVAAAVPELIRLLRDPEWWVRADAREAIEKIGATAVDSLLALLHDKDRFARNMAAEALDNIGYVDAAIWDLTKTDDATRQRAMLFLLAIRDAEGAPGLAEKIRRVDPNLLALVQGKLNLAGAA